MVSKSKASGRTAIIALTRNGARMARTLAGMLNQDRELTLFLDRRFYEEGDAAETFDLPVRPVVERAFATLELFDAPLPQRLGGGRAVLHPGRYLAGFRLCDQFLLDQAGKELFDLVGLDGGFQTMMPDGFQGVRLARGPGSNGVGFFAGDHPGFDCFVKLRGEVRCTGFITGLGDGGGDIFRSNAEKLGDTVEKCGRTAGVPMIGTCHGSSAANHPEDGRHGNYQQHRSFLQVGLRCRADCSTDENSRIFKSSSYQPNVKIYWMWHCRRDAVPGTGPT